MILDQSNYLPRLVFVYQKKNSKIAIYNISLQDKLI